LVSILLPASALAAAPYGLETRPRIGPYLDGKLPELGPGISGNWSAVVAFGGITFKNALGVTPLPGTHRLVVWEREGRVWSFDDRPEVSEKKLVLDISRQCQGWDDSGLLGLAFHPQFATNHYVYLWYAWVPPGTVAGDPEHRPRTDTPNRDRLSRFTLDANGVADPKSELVLIDQDVHCVWHKGGGMFFHPTNGFLYLTVGDDEGGGDPQRIDDKLLGGVFRIDVDRRGGKISHPISRQPANGKTANYFIPNDNPFVGRPNALEEFFCLGLRSPHRMTFDPGSGRAYIGDVGDAQREEVDIIEPNESGLNFQWPIIEGLRGDLTPPFIGINRRPVIDYDHGEGNAVIGGYVYRGAKFKDDLFGKYIFGDNGTGKIWALDERTVPPSKTQLCMMPFGPGPNSGSNYTGLSSFGIDQNNELYLCQMSSQAGHLYRLERTGVPSVRKPFPKLLSQTGAFADVARLIPSPALIPYTVNSPLWSDGAHKTRWMAVPTGEKIGYADKGEWTFPAGTVMVKHFELSVDESHPEIRRRLETRLLVRDATGSVYGLTYKWRPDNSDADLILTSLSEDVTIRTASGQNRTQSWFYPGQTDCLRCHTPAAGYVLGVKARQLNGPMEYPQTHVTDNQLHTLSHIGLFNGGIDENKLDAIAKLVSVGDAHAPIEQRARSYLDANCSHCHRPGGVHALWDARFDTALSAAGMINATSLNQVGVRGSRVIKPGDLEHSTMYRRVNSLDPVAKMPPVARNTIDPSAVDAIGQWISSMPPIGSLPKPWINDDIGAVGRPGDAFFMNNTFTLVGSGNDIWDNADGFQFLFQPLKGDGTIIARVVSISDGDSWEKAGVMIREKPTPDSRHATMMITRDQGAAFQRRATANSSSDHTPGPGVHAPYWVKLDRHGNVFTGSISDTGQAWTKVADATIEMGKEVMVGLAVTAHNNNAACTATFDHLQLIPR
jgi:uncharacterized repeat protein (TIGR03806 family)